MRSTEQHPPEKQHSPYVHGASRQPRHGHTPATTPHAANADKNVWQMMEETGVSSPDVWQMMDGTDGETSPKDKNLWQMMQAEEDAEPPEKRHRQRRRDDREKPGKLRLRHRIMLGVIGCFFVFGVALIVAVVYPTRNDDLWLELEQVPYRTETILYYSNKDTGQLQEYTRLLCTQNKTYTRPEQMPQNLKDAFVAVEDQDFYTHGGFSVKRTAYAVLNEAKHLVTGSYIGDGVKQGASTINQQLVKNLTRDEAASGAEGYLRKLREMYRAWVMDDRYEKDEILCAYLNTISFTGNTAGVGAEAYKLFGKQVEELSLAECASLAAITRNPTRYNPVRNPEAHVERRNYVLRQMQEQGYISSDECEAASAEPLALAYLGEPSYQHTITSYFTDTVIEMTITGLMEQRGLSRSQASDLIYNGGLRITTTLDPTLQTAMEQTLQNSSIYPRMGQKVTKQVTDDQGATLLGEDGRPVYEEVTVYPQAAMVSLDYSGGICAIVGGYGEKEISRGFNRATGAVRQVGSTMKAIGPYALAIEKEQIHWSSSFLDAPVLQVEDPATGTMQDWPVNASGKYAQREILVHEAFARSINTVAVRVGQRVGVNNLYSFVHNKLDITSITSQDKDLGPLVLGSSTHGITPLQLAKAYAMFGNGGKVNEPYVFTAVKNGAGTMLLEPKRETTQAVSAGTATVMNRLLAEVMRSGGTASGMAVPGTMESVGKTGTTSDHRDHWFVGLTPYYVTASWYGYDENLSLGSNSHWNPPVLGWRTVMEQGQRGLPEKQFVLEGTVVQKSYCSQSGYLAGNGCPVQSGWYKQSNVPKAGCPVHG